MKSTALEPISAVIPEVSAHDGKVITTSLAVSNYFHKRHDHVVEKIRAVMADCEPSWRLPNFRETSYQRENPNGGDGISTIMFELTRDAFVLIVMGFTGKKALQWKIDYINAFNEMEEALHKPVAACGKLNADIHLAIRDDKVVFIKHHPAGQLLTVAEALDLLRKQDWLVMPREELAVKLLKL